MSLADAAARLADEATARASGIAVAVIEGGEQAIHLDAGADPLSERTRFDVGSVAKTLTALLLAEMVVAGEVELEGVAAREITFLQLATHTSGLPPVPDNFMAKAMQVPENPWRDYTTEDLAEAVATVEVTPGGARTYSNYGYLVLGAALEAAGGAPYGELLANRVLEPLGLADTAFGWGGPEHRVPGYVGNCPAPDWTLQVPGPGGVISTINDMVRYLRAQLDPAATPLRDAIELTQQHPLGWASEGPVLWHNGGSGGFGSMIAFDRAQGRAVAILTNREHSPTIDRLALRALHEPPP